MPASYLQHDSFLRDHFSHHSQSSYPSFTPHSIALRAPTLARPIALTISTPHGQAFGLWRPARHNRAAVLLLPGGDGSLSGPSDLYTELAALLQQNVAVAQLSGRFNDALEDRRDGVLSVMEALGRQGVERVALVGWDSGGCVALAAGAQSSMVMGVACLASDIRLDPDTRANLNLLNPRRLLIAHGDADSVIPQSVSILTHMLAGSSSELDIYPDETHEFTVARHTILQRLSHWATSLLRNPFRPARGARR